MGLKEDFREVLAKSVASLSNNLSSLAVIGISFALFYADDTVSKGALKIAEQPAPAPIAIVRSRPVPISEPAIGEQRREESGLLAARRARDKQPEKSAPQPQAPAKEEAKPNKPATEDAPAKKDAEKTEPPPDVWSDAEIIAALRECVRLLAPIAAEIDVSQPVKHEECGTPAPVLLRRVGSGDNKVEVSPPVLLNCRMVAALHSWVDNTLQPIARETLGTTIKRLRSASSYACRNRNGSPHSDRLSEHAFANAVDIGGFSTSDGRTIEVARHWGPTQRDIEREQEILAAKAKAERAEREARRRAERQKEEDKRTARKGRPDRAETRGRGKDEAKVAGKEAPQEPEPRQANDRRRRKSAIETAELQKLGKGVSDGGKAPASESAAARNTPEATFLRRLHRGACQVFGTALGPEANEAHRDHFHFDLAARRRHSYCQ
jgi:hypothetical protein